MYFDFEDYRPDISPIGTAISWREGVLLSVILHLLVVIAILLSPETFFSAQPEVVAIERPRDEPESRFVIVNPQMDMPALRPPPPQAPASDMDRQARTVERPAVPTNPEPFSRGNTPERVERTERIAPPGDVANRAAAPPQPSASAPGLDPRVPELQTAQARPTNPNRGLADRLTGRSPLGDALQNPQRYLESSQYQNLEGGGSSFGPAIQFDTKGVEFGPWVRRFVAQVKSNWLIPMAAMSNKGHVVITFNVHKSGQITDLAVVKPAGLDAFNSAAYGALAASNPTLPLPSEYPAEKAFFTVTFFYNEEPPN